MSKASTIPFFKSGWTTDFVFEKHNFGVTFSSKTHHILFGNKNLSFEEIQKQFPNCEFHRLKQTHSDVLKWAAPATVTENPTTGPSLVEGDAIATDKTNLVLGVSTADCLPIVIVGGETIVGIHAGWKGVENEIILKTAKAFKEKGFNFEKAQVFVGPHILRASFEVDKTLADKFQTKYDQYLEICPAGERGYFHELVLTPSRESKDKAYIDLLNLARVQLCLSGIRFQSIHFYLQDTKSSPHWASFRREGANMGKNLTLVARRNP